MKRQDLLARISIDPRICFGTPCIRGHRIWASLILDLLPRATPSNRCWKNTRASLKRTCAPATREHFVEIPMERTK